MLPITAMAYDEQSKWDRYCLTMPVSRREVVLSRYSLGVGGVTLTTLLSAVLITLVEGFSIDVIVVPIMIASIALVFLSVMLPILHKMGAEKARLVMMLVMFLPTMLVVIGGKMLQEYGIKPNFESLERFWWVLPIAAVVITIISAIISISFYNKKEF